ASLDRGGRVVVQTSADGFGVRPASHHMGRAESHEFTAWIRKCEQVAERTLLQLQLRLYLGLGLGGTAEQQGSQECGGTDTCKHTGPLPEKIRWIRALRSVGSHNHWLGSRHSNRRAIVGEAAGARNTVIGRTS